MSVSPCWSDLDDKGFVVVKDFLDAGRIEALLQGFDHGRGADEYPFGFKLIGRAPLRCAWSRIEPVLADIRALTSIDVDNVNFLTLSHYITTRFAKRTSFLHQDFDLDYKLTYDHLNYLNFWMPLRKSDPSKSNVTLVPFDALAKKSPEEHRNLVGSGGHRFVSEGGQTLVFGNYGNILSAEDPVEPKRRLNFDLEEIAVTPWLAAGDVLVMRGDTIHRTQDADTDRVAASVRVTGSKKVITIERARVGTMDQKAAVNLNAMFEICFKRLGRTEITVGEFVDLSQGRGAR